MKLLLLVSSLASLGLLAAAAYQENLRGEWRDLQADYRALLIQSAADDNARRAAESFTIDHKQLYLPELGSIDRCTTCHLGVENPAMAEAKIPLQTHPGTLLKSHPTETFGCTICHQGEGRAISSAKAHGWYPDGRPVPHVRAPMLRDDAVYTSCGKCHAQIDLYGGEADLFASSGESSRGAGTTWSIDEASLHRSLPGADVIARGKNLVVTLGCLGCHQYRGRGGALGPDITYVGDKTRHDFDFTHVKGEHTVRQWLFEHFKVPREVSPDTLMPNYGLDDDEARDLAAYMMSLHRKTGLASHTPRPRSSAEPEPVRGETLFSMFCSACHGAEGLGSTMRSGLWPTNADPWGRAWDAQDIVVQRQGSFVLMVPSLNNPDTLAVVSDDSLRYTITHGRANTNMPGWDLSQGGGLLPDEIDRLVGFIRSWESPPPMDSVSAARGNPRYGRALYETRCVGCHGRHGEGNTVGVELNSPAFLAIASDEFLRDSIVHGRANTAMPSWKQLDADEVSDLIAYIRSWQQSPPDKEAVIKKLAAGGSPDQDALNKGGELYGSHCSICHGPEGEGGMGTPLNSDAFLSIVDDAYLYDAIVLGRPGTAMPSWKHLSAQDVADLINYVRGWNERRRRSLEPYAADGDWARGRGVIQGACAECHGNHAEGAGGPQLSNPVFLSSVTDAMLREWINHGESATEMKPRLKGHQAVADLTAWQVDDVITYLRRLSREPQTVIAKPGLGDVSAGAEVYAESCLDCHGPDAEEPTGIALTNPDLLRAASDGYLQASVVLERAMPEMGLSAEDIRNVVAYIRSWEDDPPVRGIPARYVIEADIDVGEKSYASYCLGCHGDDGKDGWAPQLNNRQFLAASTDGFLQATIVRGRHGTAMRPYGQGAGGMAELSSDAINNIVAYIRTWAAPENRPSD